MSSEQKIEATVGHEDGFDIDKAIADKAFMTFLVDHEEFANFDMGDQTFVAEKLKQYNTMRGVSDDLKSFYKGYFDNSLGITFEKYDERSVEDVLYKKAINSPEEMAERAETIRDFNQTAGKLVELDARLKELGGAEAFEVEKARLDERLAKVEMAKKMLSPLGKAKVYGSFFANTVLSGVATFVQRDPTILDDGFSDSIAGRLSDKATEKGDIIKAYKEIKSEFGKLSNDKLNPVTIEIKEKIDSISATLDSIKTTEEQKNKKAEEFLAIRKQLLEGVADFEVLAKSTQTKIRFFFASMFKKGDIASMEKAQETLDRLKKEQEGPIGMNVFGAYDGKEDLNSLQDKIDSFIERQTQDALEKSVKQTDAGNSTLARLEKTLVGYANKERMGSKKGDDVRKFIMESIKDIQEKLDGTTDNKIKRLYLARILIKLKK